MMDNPLDGRGRPAVAADVPLARQIFYLRATYFEAQGHVAAAVAAGEVMASEAAAALEALEAAIRTLSMLQLACGAIAIAPRDHLDAPPQLDPAGALGWAKGWNAARLTFEQRAAEDVAP